MQDTQPFLTVLVRTQGKRFEALKETLLSLDAQSYDAFNIILLVHNANSEGRLVVERILNLQTDAFAKRIRTEYIDGGNRATPLNKGALLVQTPYFAMLDDDDIVLENWVEEYKTAADKNFDRVIRAYSCTQKWKTETNIGNDPLIIADGGIEARYCAPFNLLAQLELNYTPISCVAIPTRCVKELNITFDESLTTTEDWDFIMRCIFAVGVCDTHKTTFLYRLWSNVETSHTLHNDGEWENNHKIIEKKLDSLPIYTSRQVLLYAKSHSQHRTSGILSCQTPYLQPSVKSVLKQLLFNIKAWIRYKRNFKKYISLIEKSKHFDAAWYSLRNPDVNSSGISSAEHYLLYGWQELRDPSPYFSTAKYFEDNSGARSLGICPLLHVEINNEINKTESD